METHNIDKIVRESLKSKTIQPSNSAWERLSEKLDAIPQKKDKKRLLYISYVASVFLLISIAFLINTDDEIVPINSDEIVVVEVREKRREVREKSQDIPTSNIQLLVSKTQELRIKSQDIPTSNIQLLVSKAQEPRTKSQDIPTSNIQQPTTSNQQLTTKKIKVDSERLLFAVTHTEEEVKQYYAKYNVDRSKVLKTIEEELRRTKLKIDAKTILAEVERTIDEDTFKKDFLEVVKGKIVGLTVAFSNRNN